MAETAYKVVGKPHRRMTQVATWALAADGTRHEITQNGPVVVINVDDIITDITIDELRAFPDRFAPATQAEIEAFAEKQRQANMLMVAPGMSPEQAREDAALQEQMMALQARRDAIREQATTPVPTEAPPPAPAPTPSTPVPPHEPAPSTPPSGSGRRGMHSSSEG